MTEIDDDIEIGSIWMHKKSGNNYTFEGTCRIEATNTPACLYRGRDGILWARPLSEFFDGRFLCVLTAEKETGE